MLALQAKGEGLFTSQRISDFETYSGLLVAVGDGWLHLSETFDENIDALVPTNMRGDEINEEVFKDEVRSTFIDPYRETAKPLYEQVLNVAKEQNSWSVWQTEALSRLAANWARDGYAEEKEEYRPQIRSGGHRMVGPKRVTLQPEETDLESSDDSPGAPEVPGGEP
jgi:hypothetical protein